MRAALLVFAMLPLAAGAAPIVKCEIAPGKFEFRDTPCPGGGGTKVDIKQSTPDEIGDQREALYATRKAAAETTERLNTQAAESRASRAAPYYSVAPAPIAEEPAAPLVYGPVPCYWGPSCWPGHRPAHPRRAEPAPPPPSVPATGAPTPLKKKAGS